MSNTRPKFRWAPMLALLTLGACTQEMDMVGPDRPGTWQPTGANAANLQAMAAVPSHLDRGVGATTERGAAGSSAVQRLLEDRRRALPIVRTTTVGGAGGGAGAGAGAAAGR